MACGLTTAALSALLFTSAMTPVYAADSPGLLPNISVSESTHKDAAQNVTVGVEGTTITVNWDPAPEYPRNYSIGLVDVNTSKPNREWYAKRGPLVIGEPYVAIGGTYKVVLQAMDAWETNPLPESKVESDPIVIHGDTAAPPSESPAEPEQPSSPSTEGNPPNSALVTDTNTGGAFSSPGSHCGHPL